ncbi:NAD(P)/FAD-dependent oxidoreductase [Microbacterium sp. NIBRBAC000506063]|uniref:NAD(P)/FAD-dependent oxidoreductase n=1 Tax=Microbacterium sp. NIBRBAC000506063 TaxID=2734618 RepID=UPI001BB80681|nr:NAD(P)/FAD-dependent oxidoreductase [Microbacterium sp. NIBRBAC000506063]QTV80497.1 FAD-dependent oxidoreductase [Microbacterium sp. NIBRBAC000506063]
MAHVSLVVIGAGVAGLSCATTARELGMEVALIEALAPGGETASLAQIDGNPGSADEITGPDFTASLLDRALDSGVQFEYAEVSRLSFGPLGTWLVDDGRFESDAVVLATGSEVGFAVVDGAQQLYGSGVSICASCDAPLFKGKDVAVIGSGRDAAYEVGVLRQFASSVIALGDWLSAGSEVRRDAAGASLEYVQAAEDLSVFRADDGRRVAVSRGNRAADFTVDGVFLAVPRVPRRSLLASLVGGDGPVLVDAALRVVGVGAGGGSLYAIGDLRAGSSLTVAGAVGDGVTAAWNVWREHRMREADV